MPGRVYTDPGRWAAAVRRLEAREAARPFLNAIRRGLKVARETAAADVIRHGIVRGIFRGPKGPRAVRKLLGTSARRRGQVFEGALKAKGLLGLQELGGRTRPHEIKPRSGGFLVFKGRSGERVFARAVHHPGGRVPRHPFMRRSVQSAEAAISAEIKRAWQEAISRTVG
jgi:hypothetical protein